MSVNHLVSSEQAVRAIQSGHRVYLHGIAAAPQALIRAMTDRASELRNVEVVQLHTEGGLPMRNLPSAKASE